MKPQLNLKVRFYRLIFLLILLIPVWSFLIWVIRPVRPLNVFILDKSVGERSGQEHRSLNCVLIEQKFSKPDHKLYNVRKDYWGFFPESRGGNFRITDLDSIVYATLDTLSSENGLVRVYHRKSIPHLTYPQIDSLADQLDVFYYTDSYGVYANEWFKEASIPFGEAPRLYGGMTEKELYLVERMKTLNKLVITEFNFYQDPTPEEIKKKALEAINVRSTGWVGCFITSLNPVTNRELPEWLIRGYMDNHTGKWPFSKPGIALIRQDGFVEILEDSTHLEKVLPVLHTDESGQKKYGVAAELSYPFWFDIAVPLNDKNTVVSWFRIETNEKGDSILNHLGIPDEFPAVMESNGPEPYYYFCADFCDNPVNLTPAYFAGSSLISNAFYEVDYSQRTEFFYEFYEPLMISILNQYYRAHK